MVKRKLAWKFLDCLPDGTIVSHRDNSPWKLGEWRSVAPPAVECVGLNASDTPLQALRYVQGSILARVECGGVEVIGSDKRTCEKMRLIRAWDWKKDDSVKLARYCAKIAKGFADAAADAADDAADAAAAAAYAAAAYAAYAAADAAAYAADAAADAAAVYAAAREKTYNRINQYIITVILRGKSW